ncbi:MAG: hypothetical protein ACRESS_12275 [Stenotrophobium sp.]
MRLIRVLPFVLVSLSLAACSQNDGPNIANANGSPAKSNIYSLFDPNAGTVPFPFDGLFVNSSGNLTGTLNIPNAQNAPFVANANLQDGYSTTASIFTDFLGFVDFNTTGPDPTTHLPGLLILDSSTGTPLVEGTDYKLQPSTAIDDSTGGTGLPINQTRTRILIEPLKPLKASTTYIVALTIALKSKDGVPVAASDAFIVVRSATPVTGASSGTQDTDPTNPEYAYLQTLTPAQKGTLEALRSQLIRPVVVGLENGAHIPEQAIALAWSFTTESTTKTLQAVNDAAVASQMTVANTGKTTQDFLAAVPPVADVYVGTVKLPYYLADSGGNVHSTAPLSTYWKADQTQPDLNAKFLGKVPCAAFSSAFVPTAPSGVTQDQIKSTTACFPVPVKQSDETVPVLATVPNANSGKTMPANGWPVVIFQHGITGNRSQMLAIAPALAAAGMVTVAMDLPLHGIVDKTSPLYDNQLLASAAPSLMTGERTFDLDLENNSTSAPGPYGAIDPSGTWFINLPSLITSRDNLREAAADLISLSKTLGSAGAVFLNAPGGFKIDPTRIYYVGHSLGGIVGGTLLGVNSDIKAATLANPGGGIAKLLDASVSFGPIIAAGLRSNGVIEGTDTYETFLRFAQTLVDSGDPINYASTVLAKHPLLLLEVCGDTVVPNAALAPGGSITQTNGCTTPLAEDKLTISSFLAGTDPLIAALGLTPATPGAALTVPIAQLAPITGANLGVAVRFNDGNHGSILNPAGSATNAAVTCEMQRETASFLATGGTALPIGGTCP